jgi:hypothetical protein
MFLMALLFFLYFSRFIINFPIQDDVNYIRLILNLKKNTFFSIDFFTYLSIFENDHISIVPKIFVLIDYWIFGRINFQHLLLFGIFEFYIICYLIYQEFNYLKQSIKYIFPIFFLLLQPQYYELFNWTITGIQQFSVILFALLSFKYIQSQKNNHIYLSGLFALCSAFSFGNGFLVFLIIIFTALIQKRFRKMGILILFSLPYILTYLFFYNKGQEAFLGFNWINFLVIFLALVGGIFSNLMKPEVILCVIGGGFVLVFILINLWKNKSRPFQEHLKSTHLLLYFCLASILIISIARCGTGISIFQSSRYLFYSPLIFCCLYISVIGSDLINNRIKEKIWIGSMTLSILIIISSFYANTEHLINRKNTFIADSENWNTNYQTIITSTQVYQNIHNELIDGYKNGLWYVQLNISKNQENQRVIGDSIKIKNQENDLFLVQQPVTYFGKDTYFYQINLGILPLFERKINENWFVIFKLKNSTYQFITPIYFKKGPKKNLITHFDYFSKDGFTEIHNLTIPEGEYELVFLQQTEAQIIHESNITLDFHCKKFMLKGRKR